MASITGTLGSPNKLINCTYDAVELSVSPPSTSKVWSIIAESDQPNPHVVMAYNDQSQSRALILANNTSERTVRFTVVSPRDLSAYTIAPSQQATATVAANICANVFVEAVY